MRLRLMTNAGLKPGPCEAASVIAACQAIADGAAFDGDVAKCRDALARGLLTARRSRAFQHIPETAKPPRGSVAPLPDGFVDQVEQFMRVLRVCEGLPSRLHIRGHHIEEVMRPTLTDLGHDPSGAGECYDAIVSLVADHNVSGSLTGQYANWLTDPGTGTARGTLAALVQARTIARDDVLAALRSRPGVLYPHRPTPRARASGRELAHRRPARCHPGSLRRGQVLAHRIPRQPQAAGDLVLRPARMPGREDLADIDHVERPPRHRAPVPRRRHGPDFPMTRSTPTRTH